MPNRVLLFCIGACLLAAAGGWLLLRWQPLNEWGYPLSCWGLGLGELAGLVLLLRNGALASSGAFYFVLAGWTLALVGGLFKILHWPGADLLLLAGLLGMALTYTVHFGSKPLKTRLAVLKLLWVLAATLGALGILLHWLPRVVAYLAHGLFWLLLLEVARQGEHSRASALANSRYSLLTRRK